MPTPFDVPARDLIRRLADYLKENKIVEMPDRAKYVKTGADRELPPEQPDRRYIRAASILRKLYVMKEPVGVGTLRHIYGSYKDRGVKPGHHAPTGGKIIRVILQQLEQAGLVTQVRGGRVLTPKGQSLLDKISTEIFKELKQKGVV